jgi:hypothetical protein
MSHNFRPIYGRDRVERALNIFRSGKIQHKGGNRYIVPSQTEYGQSYMVAYPFRCTCPDYQTKRKACKHILAAGMHIENRKFRMPVQSKRVSGSRRRYKPQKAIQRNFM